ncbi:protein SPT2 homolog [Gouania willdenowi]|uniref:Protein SPT2 homolog n=1 Tax=Gouania willdenowi TaxID=441366 RepID=A0A8C5EGK3_GOUWI|nr:protein SPT2 homolog [Gouania willdenowi]
MMDFDNVLDLATQNQDQSNTPRKRYSLQTGPPKKDPKSKGVDPAAIQALLKKQHKDAFKKEIEKKKQKEELIAKRVELKSDRKARAMASRTKDNFRGYNGIPVVEVPKKRRSKHEMQQNSEGERFKNHSIDPEDDEDNYEYEQTDSEQEEEPEPLRQGMSSGGSNSNKKTPLKKVSGTSRPAPTMNFADLLKLAETKQFEPVELKPKVSKNEERLRTAEEIKELEMERRAKRQDRDRNALPDRLKASSNLVTKKEPTNGRSDKNYSEKHNLPGGPGKKSHSTSVNNREPSFSKSSHPDRDKTKKTYNERDRTKMPEVSSSRSTNFKIPQKVTSSQVSNKNLGGRDTSSNKSSALSDLSSKKESLSFPHRKTSGISGTKPTAADGTGQKNPHGRPSQGSLPKQGLSTGAHKAGKGESLRPGANPFVKSSSKSEIRTQPNSSLKATSNSQARPGLPPQKKPVGTPLMRGGGSQPQSHPGGSGLQRQTLGPGRPAGGEISRRPAENSASGPGRPKCTVVSETISSKNVGRARPGGPPRPGVPNRPGMEARGGMPQRPGTVSRGGMPSRPGMVPGAGMPPRPGMVSRGGMPPRPMMNRPPGTMLPPITSAYKRKYEEDDEYDSEMDDFIEDEDEEQEEVSKHIREIFGYDRKRYKDESDYALKFMESSWRDVQKEEARSLRVAVQEDQEEEKRELEELKKKSAKRRKI